MSEEKNVPRLRFPGYTEPWEQRKVSDLAEKTYGGGTPTTSNEAYWNGDIPWIQSSDVVDGKLLGVEPRKWITQDGLNNSAAQLIPGNSIAIITRVGVGKLAFMPYSYATSQDFLSLSKLNEEPLFTVYACYKKLQSELNAVQGTSIKGITKDELLAKNIMVPRYAEQQQIGAFFKQLDNLITLHQRKLEHVKDLKKSMLQKMFPKNGQSYPEVRFPGFTDAWEQRKLGDIINEYKETVDSDCTLPILTSSKTEGVILQEEHFGRKQQHDITGYNILPRNYCTYRNRSDGVDFTFNINKCCDKGIISKFYPVFSGKNSDVFFLSLVLNNSEEVIREIAYTCTGTGQKVLSFLDLQKMKVRVPNFDEQKEIAAYFESLDHLITRHQRQPPIHIRFDHLSIIFNNNYTTSSTCNTIFMKGVLTYANHHYQK